MKKLIALIIAFSMLFCACCMSTSSASHDIPRFYGDVNFDNFVTITDATTIQLYLAQKSELSKLDIELADVNIDDNVSILDATDIQMYLAKITQPENRIEDTYYRILKINNLSTDYDSSYNFDNHKNVILEAGVPVTFTVHDYHYEGAYQYYDKAYPLRYEFYVNSQLVSHSSSPYYKNTFTYTFDEVGSYTVKAMVYNVFDEYDYFEWNYDVVENDGDDSFAVTGLSQNNYHFDKYNKSVVYAHAHNGTEPYEYRFVSEDLTIDTSYSQDNSLNLGVLPIGDYNIEVFVKDSSGIEVSKFYTIEVGEGILG